MNLDGYNGNPNLKRAGVQLEFTEEQVKQFLLCAQDPVHFIETYVKIVNVDEGLIPFGMRPYQRNMVKTFHENRFTIAKMPRQVGKCFHINTIVKVKDVKTSKIYEVTIGDLYDRASAVQNLFRKDEGFGFSHISKTQINGRPIPPTISKFSNKNKNFIIEAIRENCGNKQSSISTWGEIIAFFQEIYKRRHISRNDSEGDEKTGRKSKRGDYPGLLVKENQWKYAESSRTVEGKTIDVQPFKVYSKAWRRKGNGDLEQTSTKVGKKFQKTKFFENFTETLSSDYGKISIGASLFCNLEPFGNGGIYQQRISTDAEQWESYSSGFHRFKNEKNNRIRRSLLASSENAKSGEGAYERTINNGNGVQFTENFGIGLQEKSRDYGSELPKISERVNRKFIDSIDLLDVEVWTDRGWKKTTKIYKTIRYDEWLLKTKTHELICADEHIVFLKNGSEIYVKDLNVGDIILTENGEEAVTEIIKTDRSSNMFDLTVDSDEHRFYTNGILSHNTSTTVGYMLWCVLFNDNYNIAILANKGSLAREILSRIQLAYEYLPHWLQQGIITWNKGNIELENGSKIISASTSSSAVRGSSYNLIFLDEFAFVPNNMAYSFFMSTYPTISSGSTTKVIIVSTPNGLNLFYKMWMDALEQRSLYKPLEIHWSDVPGRDEKWREETIRNTSEEQFAQEFECEFLGSAATLISGLKLRQLSFTNPIYHDDKLDIYEYPNKGKQDAAGNWIEMPHIYCLTVDTSRGLGGDYSAFSVIDVSTIPYRQVAKYRSNDIAPILFPNIIYDIGTKYNDAYVLVEINDIGQQVVDLLHKDLEYDNIFKIESSQKKGQNISAGHKKSIQFGLRTTTKTKRIGCANLKTLVESDKLIINDFETINELSTFVRKKDSYEAEEGNNDDLAMTLVLFGWMISQGYFKDSTNTDLRKSFMQEQLEMIEQELTPFGFIEDGVRKNVSVEGGDLWLESPVNYLPSNL